MKRYTYLGLGLLAGFGLWQTYRLGQENPTDEAVHRREMERMSHPYAHPLAEIRGDNAFILEALDQLTSKLETAVDEAIASLPSPVNGSSSSAQKLLDLQKLIHQKCEQYQTGFKMLRDNNIRMDWRGEELPTTTLDYDFVRPPIVVLRSWYGSQKDRDQLEHEYDMRQVYQNGTEIPQKGMKPLSPDNIDGIYRRWQEQHVAKKK